MEQGNKVQRSELWNAIYNVVKQIPSQDVAGDCMDASSAATEIEQIVKELLVINGVRGLFPIEEVALHAADDWFDTAKFRSDLKADFKSYYEGYVDAMRFCQNNHR